MKNLFVLLATLAIVSTACGSDTPNSAPADITPAETTVASAITAAPTTTAAQVPEDTDSIAEFPTRILSLSPTGTEMLFAIGAGEQVIAVDSFSYYPPEAPVTELSAFEPNVEAIAEFEPDLVVFDFDPGDLVSGLEAVGIPSIGVPAASSFDDIYAEIEALGAITGNIAGAAELVLAMQTDIAAAVAAHVGGDAPLTYYHEIDTTLFSLTSATFAGQVYDLFGLVNIADAEDPLGASFGYPQLSEEYVIDQDPDLIFLADVLYEGQSLETLSARPGWDSLSAVQNGSVVELNDDVVSRWGPRVVDYVQAISDALVAMTAAA